MKKLPDKQEKVLHLDANYINFLKDVKEKLKIAQLRMAHVVTQGVVQFYWELGKELIGKQKAYKWGEYFLDQISQDMRAAFPEMQGFSKRNLQRMRQFASMYPTLSIAPQAVAQLPWGHICLLIHAVSDTIVREWYAQQTLKNGWSRSILVMQIESQLSI